MGTAVYLTFVLGVFSGALALLIRAEVRAAKEEVLDQVLGAIGSLRSDLAIARALAATPAAPASPSAPPAPTPRKVVTVTRDDDPVHTRATVVAPPPEAHARTTPAGEVERESVEEMTKVFTPGDRPTVVARPGKELVPFPEVTGSQDETPPRGTRVT